MSVTARITDVNIHVHWSDTLHTVSVCDENGEAIVLVFKNGDHLSDWVDALAAAVWGQ